MNIYQRAKLARELMENAAALLSDEEALRIPEATQLWDPTKHYVVGERVCYHGTLYKCLQEHDAQPAWNPGDTPSLWAVVLIPDPEVIPEWEQPGSTNAYMAGDQVRHNGFVWTSDVDNNVWEPGVYGWTQR